MPYTPEECDPFRDGEGAFWSILKAAEEGEYKLFYGSPVFEGREQPADLGITGLDSGHVILGFCAECAEEDMDEVCDKVTGAIKALFEKHEIPFK